VTPATDGPRRIERALGAYLAFCESGEEREAFLVRHPELRDLLEGMLVEEPPEAEAGPEQPRVLGDFRLLREVGRGGMGVVFEARQLSLDRRVALKVLPPHLTQRTSTVARFRREAAVIAGLDHANIVRVLAVGQDGDTHWFAMEFVEGTPLDRLLRENTERGERSDGWTRRAVAIAAEVADALEHAHRAGVVHRDVKPSNVLLRPDGTAVLTDFGLARDDEVPSVTLPGGRTGTPFYMSPEQAAGDRDGIDHRTDLFSLGVTLYEMLTARRPFDGDTTESVLHGIRTCEAPDPRRFNAALPGDLAAVVLRALEKEPHRRYATARDFADDLRAWLQFRPVKARAASTLLRLRRWSRREPLKAALVAVLVAGIPSVAGLLGYLLARVPEIRAGREKLLEDLLEQGLTFGGGSHRDHRKAREAFERVLAIAPGHEEGLAGLAMVIHRWEGGNASALAFLDTHRADVARSRALRRVRCFLLLLAGGARQEAERIEAELGPPVGAFEHLTAGHCEMVRAHDGDQAALDRCTAYYALAARLSARPRLTYYLCLGTALTVSDDQRARLQTVRVLEELWSGSSRAWNWIGDLRRGIDPAGAVAAYRRGLTIYPDEKGLLRNLADALREAGQADEALVVAQRLVALHPDFDLGLACLGDCLVARDRLDEGLAELERAFARSPDSHIINARLGAALLRKGRMAEARARLERALEILPRFPEAARDLAQVLLETGAPGEARRWLETTIGFTARDAAAHELLVRCLHTLGDEAALRAEQERWAKARPGG
jgi:Flp pilus assembly protein TadD/predicted Ser/Thr protein kinase